MNLSSMRAIIHQAQLEEQRSGRLARLLGNRLPQLHPSIRLPLENGSQSLLQFVSAYIEQVPDLLEAAARVAGETGLQATSTRCCGSPRSFSRHPGMPRRGWRRCWTTPIWRSG